MSKRSKADLPKFDLCAEPKHKRYISTEARSDGGRGLWLTSDRPFSEASTELFSDAMRRNKRTVMMSEHASTLSPDSRRLAIAPQA